MTLNELINKAASAYPDAYVLAYWNAWHERAFDNPTVCDTLARFIAWELYETFDPNETDQRQIGTAIGAMRHAADSLTDVAQALEQLYAELPASKRQAA